MKCMRYDILILVAYCHHMNDGTLQNKDEQLLYLLVFIVIVLSCDLVSILAVLITKNCIKF